MTIDLYNIADHGQIKRQKKLLGILKSSSLILHDVISFKMYFNRTDIIHTKGLTKD